MRTQSHHTQETRLEGSAYLNGGTEGVYMFKYLVDDEGDFHLAVPKVYKVGCQACFQICTRTTFVVFAFFQKEFEL
jgi:hypothetical protein